MTTTFQDLARKALAGTQTKADAAITRADELRARAGLLQPAAKTPAPRFTCMRDMLAAVWAHEDTNGACYDDRLHTIAAATGMGHKMGPDGGFLMQPEHRREVWGGIYDEGSVLLSRCTVIPTGDTSPEIDFPVNAETARTDGNRFGGVASGWFGEGEQISASKPKVAMNKHLPHTLGALIYATSKLLRSPVAETFIRSAIAAEFGQVIDTSIIRGDGIGKPLGIINAPGAISVTRNGSSFEAVDCRSLWKRLSSKAKRNSVFLVSNSASDAMLDFNDAGTAEARGVPLFDAASYTILGRPVLHVEGLSVLGTAGDVILADLSAYAMTVSTVQEAASMHLAFSMAETAFRAVAELDGHPMIAAPITPYTGSDTESAFVVLS